MVENRQPMNPQEFQDLQKEAGYPFVNEEKAHEFRLRKLFQDVINQWLSGPRISTRRVERN